MASSSKESCIQRPRDWLFGFHMGAKERERLHCLPAPKPSRALPGGLRWGVRFSSALGPSWAGVYPQPRRLSVSGGLGDGLSPGEAGQRPRWGPEAPQPPGGASETEAELLAHAAAVTLHDAAPVEATQAVLLELHALLAVPAAAAQQVAAAEVRGAAVAGAAARAGRAGAPVGGAEVGRVGGVEEVGAAGRLESADGGQQGLAVVGSHDTRGAVEALEQPRAHLAERGQLLPAGPQSARARQPVALALGARMAPHGLRRRANERADGDRLRVRGLKRPRGPT